jgi:hypothetical protein
MMRISGWKHALTLSLGLLAAAAPAGAEKPAQKPFADADHVVYSPARGVLLNTRFNRTRAVPVARSRAGRTRRFRSTSSAARPATP